MDRPGLRRLLAEVAAKRVDVVVIYKVDRLTRFLPDFARIVDTMDKNGVSFVSVTQQFNTTSSMGRLTLNVLLSFAQFEREDNDSLSGGGGQNLIYGNLGDALRMIDGRKSEANQAYETAIAKLKKVTSFDPESAETPLLMADWLSKIGGHEKEARQYFAEAVEREPEWDEVQITGVLIYHLLGQRQQAIQCFRKALASGVSSDEILSLPDLKELRSDQEIKRIASERKSKSSSQ